MKTRTEAKTDPIYTQRTTCRGCGQKTLTSVLDLGTHYLPRFVKERDLGLPKAPLHLVRCATCGLLQLEHTVHPDLLYREFWYRSAINETMRQALNDLVLAALTQKERGVWLDIGANDGYLLSKVPQAFHKIAVEPARNFKAELEELADTCISEYFDARLIGPKVDVVTSAAMFYDLDNPGRFLDDIVAVLGQNGIWVNQLNDAPTMFKANAFDAICHEHLCYYDLWTLDRLYREHGLTITGLRFNDVNGGSMRVTAQKTADVGRQISSVTLGAERLGNVECEAFARRIKRWKQVMGEFLTGARGNLWCYGASTKGSTLMQYLGLSDQFEAIADRNPRKIGLKAAGSWLGIESESAFRKAKPAYALVLPWAFKREFDLREAETRANGTTFVYPLPEIGLVV